MTPADILREYTRTVEIATRSEVVEVERLDTDAMAAEIARLREERNEKARAVAQIVYDAEYRAWKPMKVFRSDDDVVRDEAIEEAISHLADKVRKELEGM
jgi:hypothetical protein